MDKYYATAAEIKADLPDSPVFDTTDTSYNSALGGFVKSASRLIDKEVGGWPNYFYPSTSDETRYFDGNGEKELYVDPIVSLTSVSVSEDGYHESTSYTDWTENTDFYVWPYNHAADGQPIKSLVIEEDGDQSTWTRYRKAVKITGIFGYSATPPDDIIQACKIQTFRWFMRAKQGYQDASASAAMGEMLYMKELDPDVKIILQPYQIGNMVY